jgi:sulfite reductase (ferredoxin)
LGLGVPRPAELWPRLDRSRAGARRHRRSDRRAIAALGLERERLSIRITGCPNGCARPYTGDIGIVGRVPGYYSLYVGGDFEGSRLNEVIAERLDIASLAEALDPLFALWAASRIGEEGFGDFCHRIGIAALRDIVEGCRRKAA